jgi:outer membrane lipoprotein SlyB
MHEVLIAAVLSTGVLATSPQLNARPGVIAMAVTPADWQALTPAATVPSVTASRAEKISAQHTLRQPRATTTKLASVFIGALAGFYVDGHLGAAIDSEGESLAGPMYGACIGTAAGAVLGWKLAR